MSKEIAIGNIVSAAGSIQYGKWEALKHPTLEKVVHVEIDGKVVEACRKYLPLHNPDPLNKRIELIITDGIEYMKNVKNTFDVIVIDSTDPVGPAAGLFGYDFYVSVFHALHDNGMIVTQSESPLFQPDLIKQVFTSGKIFDKVV